MDSIEQNTFFFHKLQDCGSERDGRGVLPQRGGAGSTGGRGGASAAGAAARCGRARRAATPRARADQHLHTGPYNYHRALTKIRYYYQASVTRSGFRNNHLPATRAFEHTSCHFAGPI